MRLRTLLISTLGLGLIALAALNIKSQRETVASTKAALIPSEVLNTAQRFILKAQDKTATIEKSADGEWVVKEKFYLPADLESRLSPLVQSLQRTENLGTLTANPKRLEKLELSNASLTIESQAGKSISLNIGKETDDGMGNTIQIVGDSFALRTNFNGYIEADPAAWVNTTLFSTKVETIKALTLKFKDGEERFVRSEKDKVFAGKEGPLLEGLAKTLSVLRISEAVELNNPDALAAQKNTSSHLEIKVELYDGTVLTTRWAQTVGSEKNPAKVFVRVSHSNPANRINQLGAKAEFSCAPWLAEQIPTTLADFNLRTLPTAPAAPSDPTSGK
jgi:hypothetical protein